MKKILIANRGEIACASFVRAATWASRPRPCIRNAIARRCTCGLPTKRGRCGPSAPRESYLRIDAIIDAAKKAGADAVHPGYGFLAENEDFAAACRDAGLTFIGPSPEAITLMGSKTAARQAAIKAGVPVVPGTEDPLSDQATDDEVRKVAERIGYPLMLKAVAGGGGKGMRMVASAADLPGALRAARSEAQSAFGDGAYLERRIMSPRHIEVQLLGDHHGTVLPFVERECSIQRRHQKVVEESPSLAVSPELRRRMTRPRPRLRRRWATPTPGTIEFLLDQDGSFYFLEMNTRLQVEHPITEMVTGWTWCSGRFASREASASIWIPRRCSTRRRMRSSAASTRKIPTTASCRRPGGSRGCAFRKAPACATTAAPTKAAKCRSSTTR